LCYVDIYLFKEADSNSDHNVCLGKDKKMVRPYQWTAGPNVRYYPAFFCTGIQAANHNSGMTNGVSPQIWIGCFSNTN